MTIASSSSKIKSELGVDVVYFVSVYSSANNSAFWGVQTNDSDLVIGRSPIHDSTYATIIGCVEALRNFATSATSDQLDQRICIVVESSLAYNIVTNYYKPRRKYTRDAMSKLHYHIMMFQTVFYLYPGELKKLLPETNLKLAQIATSKNK